MQEQLIAGFAQQELDAFIEAVAVEPVRPQNGRINKAVPVGPQLPGEWRCGRLCAVRVGKQLRGRPSWPLRPGVTLVAFGPGGCYCSQLADADLAGQSGLSDGQQFVADEDTRRGQLADLFGGHINSK